MSKTVVGPDGVERCHWSAQAPEFIHYHDSEWGFPVADDYRLFEKICLESFQSGLSWRTILAKRENFREAFCQFNFNKLAKFDQQNVEQLLNNAGIVRHRGKIEATINNAACAVELAKSEGSLATYFWRFEADAENTVVPQSQSSSATSVALSKDLKKRGWKFVGPTTVYAFMQAMGLINDHAQSCAMRPQVDKDRRKFKKPK